MNNDTPYVSVIIPAYNEQSRIADSLYEIKDYLSQQSYHSEIIVVDDGSNDLTTEIVKFIDIYGKEMNEHDEGVLMENIKNVGKGYSIARGMMRASGDIVLFTDADLSTPISEFEKLITGFEEGYDVVIGSRSLKSSLVEKKPWYRGLMSRMFNLVVKLVSIRGIHDTQCGFKAYRREVAHRVAMLQRIYGFAFDVEHLYIAKKSGYKIKEVGVEWEHKDGSTLSPLNSSLSMFRDLLLIRWFHRNL
ncbi:glycosyltransferase family 2 protein [Leucothrix sargassi]|nr:glycosyltransferase family 2 protein [Leucothrix sargassi]